MTEPVEFDCQDCGVHVYAYGLARVPDPPRCSVCRWITEFVPSEQQQEMRLRLCTSPLYQATDT